MDDTNSNIIDNASCKLIIKNVPVSVNDIELNNHFNLYNPINIRILDGPLRGTAFLEFKSIDDTNNALNQLNNSIYEGRTLRAEITTGKKAPPLQKKQKQPKLQHTHESQQKENESQSTLSKNKIKKVNQEKQRELDNIKINNLENMVQQLYNQQYQLLNVNNNSNNRPIPQRQQGYSSYDISIGRYAEPTQDIINEISYHLQTRPDFYSQVLNLIKLMNIPIYSNIPLQNTPIPSSTTPSTTTTTTIPSQIDNLKKRKSDEIEEKDHIGEEVEEEEWKSDDEPFKSIDPSVIKFTNKLFPSVIPTRVLNNNKVKPITTTTNNTSSTANTTSNNKSIMATSTPANSIQFDIENTNNNNNNIHTNGDIVIEEIKNIISIEQSNNNKVTFEELETINKKKIEIGEPTNKLYIKNISKHTSYQDFESLFRRYFETVELMKSQLTIDYHKEGKLRNQAFITFPSIELASLALTQTQGYKLHQKPLLILYSKNKQQQQQLHQPETL